MLNNSEQRHDFQNCFCFMPQETNKWGIPSICGVETLPDDFEVINSEFARKGRDYTKWVQFYEWDFKFERMWTQPKRQAKWLSNFAGAVSPQFSIYCDTPLSIQLMSVYKSRWCGAYWESLGIPVIPCVTWGDERTWDFCFEGIKKDSIVSISNMGMNTYVVDYLLFMRGFEKMLEVLSPKQILIYGTKMEDLPYKNIIWC